MNPSGKLAKPERLVSLREPASPPRGPFRGMLLLALLVFLPMPWLWAHGAITAGSG